jgi:hypothetical protein
MIFSENAISAAEAPIALLLDNWYVMKKDV